MNAPDREESVITSPEEIKLAYKVDAKVLNSANFTLWKEDHTIGNMLRMKLLEDPHVRFAGYRHPHPLETLIEVKIRTNGEKDSLTAFADALMGLQNEVNELENNFENVMRQFHPEGQYDAGDMMR